ncbi:MAG: efflux RND transporter permease subunit, partial [Rhizobiales bacterium]|nr:efflux RND transporter permease subunit [Hyphomicrobiales bacterium]
MDSILKNLLNRPKTILTLMVVLIFAGFASYVALPKEGDPDIPIPIFLISLPFQGISPEDADKLLVKPMETELRTIEGLKKITSSALQGFASIVLEFDVNFDKEKASIKVREKVDKAKSKLPAGANEPSISEFNTALNPVINVTISGQIPERSLKRYADLMQDALEGIDTVLEANMQGIREEVLEITIDSLRLESFNITTDQLINAMRRNNQLISAGALQSDSGNFSIKLPGLFKKREDVLNLPIKSDGDIIVTLSDVSSVKRTFKDATGYARVNGKPAVSISVVKRLGTNLIATNEKVREVVAELTKDWDKSVEVGYVLDSSVFIFEVMNSLQSSIITAIILVMIVVMAVMSIRSSLLVGISIPASFLMGFVVISVMGMTLNMMVMFGLVLTVGILVDGAIVIVEFADRKMTEGLNKKDAYILSAQRMFWPIFSSTATTLAAFLPLLLWPGVTGKFMSFLPITVVVVLSVALVTAMIFMPAMGALFGKPSPDDDPEQAAMLSGGSHVEYAKIKGASG